MKIQHKITWISSALFGAVFLLVAGAIYFAFDKSSKNIFYGELARTANVTAMFYLEKDELSRSQYEPIEKAFYNLSPEQKVSIYNEQDNIAFDTDNNRSKTALPHLTEIRRKGSLNFKNGLNYYHGLYYKDNQGNFVVIIRAQSPLIQSQLENLLLILVFSFLVAMSVLIFFTSRLSRLAYQPVRNIISQVMALNLMNKPLTLSYEPTGDELEELFEAFNGLLEEIERTYEQQKNFIDYASHELKTPITNIINHTEINLQRERDITEYRDTLKIVLGESERLRDIMKNLLTLSSINRIVHQKVKFRVDELVWDVIDQLKCKYAPERFRVCITVSSENYEILNFVGNETLLAVALYNFLDNAAKFSGNKPVAISLEEGKEMLTVKISDEGMGMSPDELSKITQPFYRAPFATAFDGSGLGLSIAARILELHQVPFTIGSLPEKGTTVTLTFPASSAPH